MFSKPPSPLIIATRKSRLALWQANHVQALLGQHNLQSKLLALSTRGDQILDRSLSKVGGKGLFVKELELALLSGQAHMAVHSLKDVPVNILDDYCLPCVLPRGNVHDAFVSNHFERFENLPYASVVGTSSLRRQVLLKHLRPDLIIRPLRGNLDTRLHKLDEGQFDAIVLASVGLQRLQLQARIRHEFSIEQMLPAPGQGALGIEVCTSAYEVIASLKVLSHKPSWLATEAERAVSRALGGSCSVPLAAHAQWLTDHPQICTNSKSNSESHQTSTTTDHRLLLRAAWSNANDDQALLQVQCSAKVSTLSQARALGEQAAKQLIQAGAIIQSD